VRERRGSGGVTHYTADHAVVCVGGEELNSEDEGPC
jgi:hypothetical protein